MMTFEEQQRAIEMHFQPLRGLEKAHVESIEPGKVRVSLVLDENMMNYKGTLHGGFLSMVGEAVFGLDTYLYDCLPNVTMCVDYHFVSPSRVGDTLFFSCETLHKGRSSIVQELIVTNQTGKLIAFAHATMLPMPGKA
mgnify:CR=1 FL=1